MEPPLESQCSLRSVVHSDLHGAFTQNQQPSGTTENPQQTVQLTAPLSLSPPCLPHYNKPHSNRTDENTEVDQLDNRLFIYTCFKKKRAKIM